MYAAVGEPPTMTTANEPGSVGAPARLQNRARGRVAEGTCRMLLGAAVLGACAVGVPHSDVATSPHSQPALAAQPTVAHALAQARESLLTMKGFSARNWDRMTFRTRSGKVRCRVTYGGTAVGATRPSVRLAWSMHVRETTCGPETPAAIALVVVNHRLYQPERSGRWGCQRLGAGSLESELGPMDPVGVESFERYARLSSVPFRGHRDWLVAFRFPHAARPAIRYWLRESDFAVQMVDVRTEATSNLITRSSTSRPPP